MYQQQSGKILAQALTAVINRRLFNLLQYGTYSAVEEIEIEAPKDETIAFRKNSSIFDPRASNELEESKKLDLMKNVTGKMVLQKIKSKQKEEDLSRSLLLPKSKVNDQDLTMKEKVSMSSFANVQSKFYHGKLKTRSNAIVFCWIGLSRMQNKAAIANEEAKKQSKKKQALRIGDVVYFKQNLSYMNMNTSMNVEDLPSKTTSIVSGDGVASSKLECITFQSTSAKNAHFMFKKCLFRVETTRKYNYAKLYNYFKNSFKSTPDGRAMSSADYDQRLAYLKQKVDEEREENNQEYEASLGQPVIYGQSIQLRHIYSSTRLTLNNHGLAKQYGCVELSLEEHGSELTNFRFLSSNNLRNNEDVVHYSDSLILNSVKDPSMYIHVWDEHVPTSKDFF